MAALNDEKPKRTQIILEQDGKLCAGKQSASIVIKQYAETSDLQVPEPERKSLTLEYVNIKYPEEQWTHTYTDGSAAEAIRDGGGGVYISYNDGIAQITIATGKYSTNFKAEAEALKRAAIEIRNNLPRTKPNVVIFTDALSVLSKLQNPCQKDLNEVETVLVDLAAQSNLTLQWIPAHCGIQ